MKRRPPGYKKPADWKPTLARVLARDQYACYFPGCTDRAISVDHIVAVAAGGGHDDGNLAAICPTHKAIKDEQDRLNGLARHHATRGRRRQTEEHPNISHRA